MTHLGRKIYHCVYLVSPVSVVGESLEVDHKHLHVSVRKVFFSNRTRFKYGILPQVNSKDQTSLLLAGVFGSLDSTYEQTNMMRVEK